MNTPSSQPGLPSAGPPVLSEMLAAILMGGLGVTVIVSMPLLGPLFGHHFGVVGADIGIVSLANLLGTAAGSLFVTIRLDRLPWRRTSLVAAVLALTAQLLVAAMPGFVAAAVLETVTGLAAGVLLALSSAIVGQAGQSDRGFAFILALQAVVAVGCLVGLPVVAERAGAPVAFAAVALPFLAILPAAFLLRPAANRHPAGPDAPSGGGWNRGVLALVAAHFLFSASVGILWTFSAVLGGMSGLADIPMGLSLAVGNVAALFGSLAAAAINLRYGRILPLGIVSLLLLVSAALFATETDMMRFNLACALYLLAWGGGMPFFMGAVSQFDRGDRITALLPVLAFAGMAAGPAIVVMMPGMNLFQAVAWATAALALFAFALIAAVSMGARTRGRGETAR